LLLLLRKRRCGRCGKAVRPFWFLLVYTAKGGVFADPPNLDTCVVDAPKRGSPPKTEVLKPIAPFDNDPARALPNVIDRVTGESIASDKLETYAEALCQYHLSSEDKSENGQVLDRGRTERRHVRVSNFVWIGKEANRGGDSGDADPVIRAVNELFRTSK
jgi:hypothetical protein